MTSKEITSRKRTLKQVCLVDIVCIGLVSVICEDTDFEQMEDTGEAKHKLGQLETGEKSNEITAIPEHIDIIDIEGSTVTIDAMGCQKQIASKIRGKGAEYVLGLKRNQPSLLSDVQLHFERECPKMSVQTSEKDYGRIEKREYCLETDIAWLAQCEEWSGLRGMGTVISSVTSTKTGEFTRQSRYFLTSLTDAGRFAEAVRKQGRA